MKRPSICAFFLLLSLMTSALNALAHERIAVIGAGAAGIKAASLLTEKGDYDVVVFEQRGRIGGKVNTEKQPDGSLLEYGALLLNEDDSYVSVDVDQLNQEAIKSEEDDFPPKKFLRTDGNGSFTTRDTGDDVDTPTYESPLQIFSELLYLEKLKENFELYVDPYKVPDPSEYTVSFEKFMTRHHLHYVTEFYRQAITGNGYGSLSSLPAFIPLTLANAPTGATLMLAPSGPSTLQLNHGLGGLLDAMVAQWALDVRLSHTITAIDRHPDRVIIKGVNGYGQVFNESFSRIIVACPIDKIYPALNQPTDSENLLDKNILYNPYHVIVAQVDGLPEGFYALSEKLDQPGHLQTMYKRGNQAVLYSPQEGPVSGRTIREHSDTLPSIEKTSDTIKWDLKEYGLNLGAVTATRAWNEHFPHFNRPLYYRVVSQMQGERRTYYVGTMTHPADFIDNAFKSAVEVVGSYFPDANTY